MRENTDEIQGSTLDINEINSYYTKVFLKALPKIEYGVVTLIMPDSEKQTFEGSFRKDLHATLYIKNWKVAKMLLLKGDIGFAEAYRDDLWDCDNLATLFQIAVMNEVALEELHNGSFFGTLLYKLKHFLMKQNTKKGSKKNIHDHYDLGNKFFSLWLDKTMTYSSALFNGDLNQTLESAQEAKYLSILHSLNLKPNSHILEIGCGWGGFAEIAGKHGHRVTCVTISNEQFKYATNRIQEKKLSDKVTIELKDYRDIVGQYDAVVSIEMIEAVGKKYWDSFFKQIKHRLLPGGVAMIQGITILDAAFKRYQNSTDFIQQYIFPGGMLVADSLFVNMAQKYKLECQIVRKFGHDYAETLKRWNASFKLLSEKLLSMGYDHKFQKIWEFYLTSCQGSFLADKINVVHVRMVNNV